MKNRIRALREGFQEEFDGYLVTNEINMLYFTHFLGAAAMLVPNGQQANLYVYGVNYEAAKAEAQNVNTELVKKGEDLWKKVAGYIKDQRVKKLGFDTMNTSVYNKLADTLKDSTSLEAKSEHVWNLRRVKDEEELQKMRKAAELTSRGMQAARETIKQGLREYEVAAQIEYAMRSQGSYGVAFDSIVTSGSRSAYPHGGCNERKIGRGEPVVVDIGATYKNYRSDMTRTFVVGKASAKQRKIHTIVKEAQEKAFEKIRDGANAAEVDRAARNTIRRAKYGKCFVHGLGHGIGLDVHEQPVLNATSKDILKERNVVTDEPGIYIVGFGGFRIEDTVLVRKSKGERLTEGSCVLEI